MRSVSPDHQDQEVSIAEIFRQIWLWRYVIGGLSLLGTIVAIAIALWLPNYYKSEVLLAPNKEQGPNGIGGLASQFGGIAGLAGINLRTSEADSNKDLALEVLRSRKFLSEFIARYDLLIPMMAAKDWDSGENELILDEDIYDTKQKKWVRDVPPPRAAKPSLLEARNAFLERLAISEDDATGFVRLSVIHYSPFLAQKWVDLLVADLNEEMRSRDLTEARRSIDYLNEQVVSTSVVGVQEVFFSLIEEQTKKLMLASSAEEYMFRTIDPPVVPELKAGPKRTIIVFLGGSLGFVIGLGLSLMPWRRPQ